jgi:hypothetical protein
MLWMKATKKINKNEIQAFRDVALFIRKCIPKTEHIILQY